MSPDEHEALKAKGTKAPVVPVVKEPVPTIPPAPVAIKKPTGNDPISRFEDDDDRPVWGSHPSSVSSANAQSQAVNKHGGNDQTAGANSYNHNVANEHGLSHNSGASSIGSNIAEDGKAGQVSSANTQKQMTHTADGYNNLETSQSQSANWDQKTNSLQATDSNTKQKHTIDKTGEKKEISSGSSATNQNQFGAGNANAQTNVVDYNQNGVQGTKTDSIASSIQTNKDGSTANTHTHSGTNVFKDKDGNEVTESKAGSTSVAQGQNSNSASNANCGSSGVNKGGAGGGGFSSSFSSSSSSSFSTGNGQTVSQTGCESGSKAGGVPPPGFFPNFVAPFQPFPVPYPNQWNG